MTKLISSIIAVGLLSGCAAGSETVRDLSTGEQTALIDGGSASSFTRPGSCRIIWPRIADLIVVDAGPVIFVEFCEIPEPGDWSGYGAKMIEYWAVFQFDAEAGHTYEIKRDTCMKLLDVTAGKYSVACEPYFFHGFKDLSTGDDTAVVRSGAQDTWRVYCSPTKEQRISGFLFIDAGSDAIDVTCRKTGRFGGHPRILTSSFDFEAQAGHTYTFSAEDDECIKLLDITSEAFVIACESYEQRDEEK